MYFTFTSFDSEENEIEYSYPGEWAICSNCTGSGKKDHPAFSNGISSYDFDHPADYADFIEEYKAGQYDVSCSTCSGSGKVIEVSYDSLTAEQKVIFDSWQDDKYEYDAEMAYEQRMRNLGYEF